MRKLILLFICLSTSNIYATDFLDISLEKALIKATEENKKVLIYFHAKWCGPCRGMEKNVFPNDTLSRELRDKYISLKIDGESWAGERLVKDYNIVGYPTFMILNSQKEVLVQRLGAMSVSDFRKFIATDYEKEEQEIIPERVNQTKLEISSLPEKHISYFKPELGIRLGVTSTRISNYTDNSKLGYDLGFFVSMENRRFLIRPGISLLSKGGVISSSKLNFTYLQVPIDFGLTIYKGVWGLPSGIRVLVSPYSSILLNSKGKEFKNLDYGFSYGVGTYIGGLSSSKLELMLTSERSLHDINNSYNGIQNNRLFCLSISLTL